MDDCRHLADSLHEFAQQHDTQCLLLMISDQDTLFPLKLLSSYDREQPDSLVLVFPQPCRDAGGYIDAIAQHVRLQLDAVDAQLREDGHAALEPMPESVLDPRDAPADRLAALVDYVGRQVDARVPVLWALLPVVLDDLDGFRTLTRAVVPDTAGPKWPDRHRFVVRESLDGEVWVRRLHAQKVDDAVVFRFEMDRERVLDGLTVVAADSTRPDEERAGAMLQLAGVDVAHSRVAAALRKYSLLQRLYGRLGQPALQALAYGGAGDALRRDGRDADALAMYRRGLAVAVGAAALQAVLTLSTCAGEVCLALSDLEEAEGYFGVAMEVAAKLANVFARCDSMEKRGLARAERGDHRGAVADWVAAKDVSKRYAYETRFTSSIDRLIDVYQQARLPNQVAALRAEKAGGVAA